MYCFSKICCFCLQSNVQLKFLKKRTHFSTTQMTIIKFLIGESLFSEVGHVLSICKACTRQVKEMHSFWQASIKNNMILMKYLQQLRTLGNDFGHIQIQINDIQSSTDPEILLYKDKFCTNKNIYTAENNATDGVSKIKEEDDQDLSGNEDDAITYKIVIEENGQYDNQIITQEKEIKIEVQDDFEKIFGCLKCESNEMQVEYPEKSIRDIEELTPIKEEPMPEDFEAHTCDIKQEKIDEFSKELIEGTEEQIPDNSKPYKCETCGRSFAFKRYLIKHLLIHTGEKPHTCESCEKSFARKSDLAVHMILHTGEKPYTCEICGKSFAHRNNLTSHMSLHTGEKPHKCETCEKSFARKRDLSRHMLTHTGEKPYTCEICGKSFARKSVLTIHTLLHTEGKPYICETCGKCFAQKINLTRHVITHE